MSTEKYNKNDIKTAYYVQNNLSTKLKSIYFKETATDLPQLWWSANDSIDIEFTYYTDYWGNNEETKTWTVEKGITWAELIKTDEVRFYQGLSNSVIFSPSQETIEDRDSFFSELAGLDFTIAYTDNGTTITYSTDRVSYFVSHYVTDKSGKEVATEVKATDEIIEGEHYFLMPRVKEFGEEKVQIQRVQIGDNKIVVKETTIALFVCQEKGKYKITAQSDNAYLEYMLDNVEETYEVENNEFEIELTNYDNLKVICATQDYSSETYNLKIEKIE